MILDLGPVVRRGIKTYRFPWYLTLVSANHASSNPDLIYGYSKPLEKASYYTKSKGRKEESIGGVFKKLILVESSYT